MRPKVAVVLSGGGAKGFCHVGVLKVLEKEGIPIDIVVGTSIGSIVGGMYAIGYTPEQIEQFCRDQDWGSMLTDKIPRRYLSPNEQTMDQRFILSLPLSRKRAPLPQGVIQGQNILDYFCGLSSNIPENADFSKFPRAFACVATDLESGEKVIMKNGSLPTAMYASMAIPGAFAPCHRDGRLLVDGGLVDNFPLDVAKSMGADIIIGVDIRSGLVSQNKLHNIADIVSQLISLYDPGEDSLNKQICNVIIKPDINGFSPSSFSTEAVDTLVRRGKESAYAEIKALRKLKSDYGLQTPDSTSSIFTQQTEWQIDKIDFDGIYSIDKRLLKDLMEMQTPHIYSYKDIKKGIDKLYGTKNFNIIFFSMRNDSLGGKILTLHLKERKNYTANIGFCVNTTDAASLLLNVNYRDYSKALGLLSGTIEFSSNPGATLVGEVHYRNYPVIGINLSGKIQDFTIYYKGDKLYSADIYHLSGSLYGKRRFLNVLDLGLRTQLEYYNSDIFMSDPQLALTDNKKDLLVANANIFWTMDNYDDFYFPSRGVNLKLEGAFFKDFFQDRKNITPIITFKMKSIIPLNDKLAMLLDIYNRSICNQNHAALLGTFVGGTDYSIYFDQHLPFIGLPPVSHVADQTGIALLGLRWNWRHNHYISFKANVMRSSDELLQDKNVDYIFGIGGTYGIKTSIGPIDLTLGASNYKKTPTIAADLGYWF